MLGSVTYFPAERRRGKETPEGWIVRIGDKQALRGSFSAAVRMALFELLPPDEAEAIMFPGGAAVSQPRPSGAGTAHDYGAASNETDHNALMLVASGS